ncbi:MAG TPA: permease-like cell division protein FtsX [Nevskiales bacterium]|nr:permease-like cell division protein FtsX [Nevskiales bacterium]
MTARAGKLRGRDATLREALLAYLREHLRVLLFTLRRLLRNPGGSLLTAAAIGITLALPAGLHVLLQNISTLSYSWESSVQASLFLRDSVSEADGQKLARELAKRPGVADAQYISRAQALAEFRQLSGFGEALDVLQENPLPAVIVVQPDTDQGPQQIDQLVRELSALPGVDQARLDTAWLERLYAILDIVRLAVQVIGALLALAIVITVGNTIRLDIQSRREEIVVLKLIGATDAFIRRPFLYTGACFGLLGGALAWLLVTLGLWTLSDPVQKLASLYQSDYRLSGLGLEASLVLLFGALLLGWLGSWWTVARHLGDIEPR